MRNSSLFCGVAAAALACASGLALVQYPNEPFITDTVLQSQARALDIIGLRLDLLEAFDGPIDDEVAEEIEAVLGDHARFGGTLAERDPELATALYAALGEVAEAVEEGEEAGDAAAETRELLERAYDVVVDPAVQDTPAFRGARLADLLVGEPGVAEGLEEAAEEPAAFSLGWAALQRVKVLWGEIAGTTTEQRRGDAEEMIAFIDPLYPSPEPPEQFVGNPEEAEAPAQRLLGIVEEVTDANLYSGRDLAGLAGHLADILAPACETYGAGEEETADETVYAVQLFYEAHLGELVGLFAPDVNEEVEDLLGMLVVAGEDDDEELEGGASGDDAAAEDEADADAEDDEDEAVSLEPAEACLALGDALLEARAAIGG